MKDQTTKNKRLMGIWLDSQQALIVELNGEQETLTQIKSKIRTGKSKGGTGMSTPYGPQDGVSESKMLEKRNNQFKKYYDDIIQVIKSGDELYVFGPAETKIGLRKVIQAIPSLGMKLAKVETSDSMTLNEVKAQVREFFKERE